MKTRLLLGFLSLVVAPICAAQSSGFTVDLISPSKEYLYVDNSWQTAADCLQVKLSVTEDVSDPVMKAYFYSTDGKLLHMEKKPSVQSDGQGGTIQLVKQFQKGKKYQVFFAIPSEINSGSKKWKRAIIVFGKSGDFAAKIYPKDDLAKFDFPEKAATSASSQ